MKRVGCFPGEVDATWTPKASEALARYLKAANKGLPSEGLTLAFLEQLKADPARTCPSHAAKDRSLPMANVSLLLHEARRWRHLSCPIILAPASF